jgi:hypothetical protein
MATRTYALSVTTTIQQLCGADKKRRQIMVFNLGSNTVYICSAQNMLYTDGYPVLASSNPYKNKECTSELWIIAATGTNDVRVQVDSE